MKSNLLILIALFYTCLLFGQKQPNASMLNTRVGLGASYSGYYGLNAELSIEKDLSKKLFIVGRVVVAPPGFLYGLRWGAQYKLIGYKNSYLSLGMEYFYARTKSSFVPSVFESIFLLEFPLSLNIAINKKFIVETNITSAISIFDNYYNNVQFPSLLRAGVKYQINR